MFHPNKFEVDSTRVTPKSGLRQNYERHAPFGLAGILADPPRSVPVDSPFVIQTRGNAFPATRRFRGIGSRNWPLEPGRAHRQLHHRQRCLRIAFGAREPAREGEHCGRVARGCRHGDHPDMLCRGFVTLCPDGRPLCLRAGSLRTLHGHSGSVAGLVCAAGLMRSQRESVRNLSWRILAASNASRDEADDSDAIDRDSGGHQPCRSARRNGSEHIVHRRETLVARGCSRGGNGLPGRDSFLPMADSRRRSFPLEKRKIRSATCRLD
jgi:hypothetical protein